MTHPLAALLKDVPRYTPPYTRGDWFKADDVLAALEAAPVPDLVEAGPPFFFDRYINGVRMAEDVCVERETTLEGAIHVAARIAAKGPNGEPPVLVYRHTETAALIALATAQAAQIAKMDKAMDGTIELLERAKADIDGNKARAEAAEAEAATLRAEVERLRAALRLIELIGYREGEDFGWINAHMRGVATSIMSDQSIDHYWRLFPNHRAALGGKHE